MHILHYTNCQLFTFCTEERRTELLVMSWVGNVFAGILLAVMFTVAFIFEQYVHRISSDFESKLRSLENEIRVLRTENAELQSHCKDDIQKFKSEQIEQYKKELQALRTKVKKLGDTVTENGNTLKKDKHISEKNSQDIKDIKQEVRDDKDILNIIMKKTEETEGAAFVRWGRTNCPDTSTLIYTGYTGGSHFSHKGAAAEFLCLPKEPEGGTRGIAGVPYFAYVYGSEYQHDFFGAGTHDHDVPCTVCLSKRGSNSLMIPARNSCYDGWTLQYRGYLGAGYHDHPAATEYICVDETVEQVAGGHENKDGKLIYTVIAKCGSLKCSPYKENQPLSCVVCTR